MGSITSKNTVIWKTDSIAYHINEMLHKFLRFMPMGLQFGCQSVHLSVNGRTQNVINIKIYYSECTLLLTRFWERFRYGEKTSGRWISPIKLAEVCCLSMYLIFVITSCRLVADHADYCKIHNKRLMGHIPEQLHSPE